MGTVGASPPSASFSCVPGITADEEVISSSPPGVLSSGAGDKVFEVETAIGELCVKSTAGFTVAEVESGSKN